MDSKRDELKNVFKASDACLDIDAIASFVHGDAGRDFMRQARAHMDSCSRCLAEVALFRSFIERSPSAGEAADVEWITRRLQKHPVIDSIPAQKDASRPVTPAMMEIGSWNLRRLVFSWRMPGLALAAVVLLAAGVVLMYRSAPEFSIPNIQPGTEVRSSGIDAISPSGDLLDIPTQLSWKAAGGASRYRARVFEVDGNELWRGESFKPSIPLPKEIERWLVPGKKLLWQVSALDAGGKVIQSSPEVSFRLMLNSGR